MDIALVLGLLEYLHGLFIGDVAAVVGLAAVVGKVADANAPFALDVAGALSADTLLLAAGADGHADVALIFLEPVAEVFDRQGLALGQDGLLDGDDVHTDTRAAGRHQLGDAGERQISHALEEIGSLGVHVGHLLVVLVGGVFQRGVYAQIFRGVEGDLVLAEQYGRPVSDLFAEFCDLFVLRHGIFKPPEKNKTVSGGPCYFYKRTAVIVLILLKTVNKLTPSLV